MGIQINGQTDTVTATDGSINIGGNVTVPGVLTYEDVTSVDAVGLSTFQNGIHVTGGSVGIGTDNPVNRFHATQYTANTDVATFQIGSASSYTGFVNCRVGTTGAGSFIGGLYTPDGSLEGLQGTNGLIFSTSGSNLERLRITSSGNLGINTTTPKAKLDVMSTGNFTVDGDTFDGVSLMIRNDGGTQGNGNYGSAIAFTQIGNPGVAGYRAAITSVQTGADSDQLGLAFLTHPTVTGGDDLSEALRITSDGKIGIGTDAPWSKLSVYGDSISFGSGPTTSDNRGILQYNSQNGDLDLKANSTGGNTFIRFYTSDAGSVAERLHIDSNGNIAIGSAGLDSLSSRTSQAYQSLRIQNANITAGNSQYAYFGVNYYQHTDGVVKYIDAGYSGRIDMWGDYISFHLSNGAAADDTISNSERLRITSDGRVGINEITPNTTLTVNGSINVEKAVYGKRFDGSLTVDTGIMVGDNSYFSHGVIEVIVSGNPNHFGSGYYRASSTYLVHIGTGWTGSAISTIINATRVSYGVGGSGNSSEVTATFVLYNALTSTEKNSGTARDANTQLRVKIAGCSTASGARCFVKVLSNDSWLT